MSRRSSPPSSLGTAPSKPPRQQPGLACDECRVRKLRCDRGQPECGSCRSLDIACHRNTMRQPRGPKTGHITLLKARIAALERRLGEDSTSADDYDESSDPTGAGVSSQGVVPLPPSETTLTECDNLEGPSTAATGPRPSTMHLDEAMQYIQSNDPAMNQPAPENEYFNTMSDFYCPDFTGNFDNRAWSVPHADFVLNSHAGGVANDDASVGPPGQLVTPPPSSLQQNPLHDYMSVGPTFSWGTPPLEEHLQRSEARTTSVSSSSTTASKPGSYLSSSTSTHEAVFAEIPPLIRADLDHLYFDRLHPCLPLLHQNRYFARVSKPDSQPSSFTALQCAMWTLASSVGTQFRNIQSRLYTYSRSLLVNFESTELPDAIPIEHIQAWMLIAIYEITQADFQLGWITAGHCFRLVHLANLHQLDDAVDGKASTLPDKETWTSLESKRRTFWIAYILDRCINLVNQLPLTLTEQIIRTNLPAPERAFQQSNPTSTSTITDAMARLDEPYSSFTDTIILVTITGRCLSLQHSHNAEQPDSVARMDWLDRILARKIPTLLQQYAQVEQAPFLLLFTSMIAYATRLLLCTPSLPRWREKAAEAVGGIVELLADVGEYNYFKIHPFTPIPLFVCAKFLRSQGKQDPMLQGQYARLFKALGLLCSVNKLASTCKVRLELGNKIR